MYTYIYNLIPDMKFTAARGKLAIKLYASAA